MVKGHIGNKLILPFYLSSLVFSLISSIPSYISKKDREKLGTKTVQEEYHGIWNNGSGPFKQLYGWGTINANVWLPSLSELVGYNPDTYNESYGTYLSAMQGLNVVTWYFVDTQGGNQFSYFQQFNGNGGGEKLWACGGSEQFLLRSVRWDNTQSNWIMRDVTYFHTPECTTSLAVHLFVVEGRIEDKLILLFIFLPFYSC